ncbi:MAG: hypothetical protein JSW47_02170 [Phycisphaerales bacterium]|nr:MAG: hypothetical protein JSW47_02170 [Phycisphaerales bacterium]
MSDDLDLDTQIWRTDRGDKEPTVIPVRSEKQDDTILATTDGRTVQVRYVDGTPPPETNPPRCQAITQAATQCKRRAAEGSSYYWQHRD